jgi:superoxide reductase
MKFFICEKCGNLVAMINESGVKMVCCGQKMTELQAGTVDASREKHIPVVEIKDGILTATVGSVQHPMTPEHSIQWICLETNKGFRVAHLTPSDLPTASFALGEETPIAVYEYCNLHGLWKADV